MTGMIVTRLLINSMPLSSLILINSKNFFTRRKKTVCLVEKNNKLTKLLCIKIKTKKINFQLSLCFLKKKKPTFLSTAKSNKISYNISFKNVFNSLKEHNAGLSQKLYKKNIKKYLTKHCNLYSNNKTSTEEKNCFSNMMCIAIRRTSCSVRKSSLLQDFKAYKPNAASPLPMLSLMQRSLNPEPILTKKIKSEANYLAPVFLKKIKSEANYLARVFLKKSYLTKKNLHNNPVLKKLKSKAIVALRKKNKNGFNNSMPITFSSQSQHYASKLIQNILCLNTTIKEAYSVASLAPRIQEDKHNDLIKLDKRLSHIQEIIEGQIQTKQNERNNLTFNPFNEKRKKTYSDFL